MMLEPDGGANSRWNIRLVRAPRLFKPSAESMRVTPASRWPRVPTATGGDSRATRGAISIRVSGTDGLFQGPRQTVSVSSRPRRRPMHNAQDTRERQTSRRVG